MGNCLLLKKDRYNQGYSTGLSSGVALLAQNTSSCTVPDAYSIIIANGTWYGSWPNSIFTTMGSKTNAWSWHYSNYESDFSSSWNSSTNTWSCNKYCRNIVGVANSEMAQILKLAINNKSGTGDMGAYANFYCAI